MMKTEQQVYHLLLPIKHPIVLRLVSPIQAAAMPIFMVILTLIWTAILKMPVKDPQQLLLQMELLRPL